MKKIITYAAAVLVCATMIAKPVSRETARQVAINFWMNTERGLSTQKVPEFQEISTELGLHGFYVFATTENDGFVIVSADDAMTPILGYSTRNGIAKGKELPPNLKGWMGHYSKEAETVRAHGLVADEATADKWEKLVFGTYHPKATEVKDVNILLSTYWGPNEPYNNLCPIWHDTLTRTGCVATAMAQVMKYHEWPITGTGSHSYVSQRHHFTCEADFGNTTYEWENMPNGGLPDYTPTDSPTSTWTETQKNAVATLMYHCGVSVNMDYDLGTSWTYTRNEIAAMTTYFGYPSSMRLHYKKSFADDIWISLLKKELDANRPMLYRGTESNYSGHMFVCDGYDADNMFHFNMGWNGYGDGFFALTSIVPDITYWTADYTYNQDAIFGITRPDNPVDDSEIIPDMGCRNFQISSPVAYGSDITGLCTFFNAGNSTFEGYVGVAAYLNDQFVGFLAKSDLGWWGTQSYDTTQVQIASPAIEPLFRGTYTAKAVCSTDGTNWKPILKGDGQPTSQTFTITGGPTPPNNAIKEATSVCARLYPNPTNGLLHVEAKGLQKIEVIDATGRIVTAQTCGDVNMSQLNKGIYTIRITAEGSTILRKVAKQ